MASNLIIAVGGTGQQVAMTLANLVYLKAVPQEFRVKVIDADDSSGGLTSRLKTFHGLVDVERPLPLYPHPLRWNGKVGSPYSTKALAQADAKNFRALMKVGTNSPQADQAVFDSLFADSAASLDVSRGFYARPTVGASAFAAQGAETIKELKADAGNAAKLFFVGSLIGGTGAGVLPSMIEQLVDEKRAADSFGVFLLNWLKGQEAAGADAVGPAKIDSNFRHGSAYFYSHIKERLKASALLGPPPAPSPTTGAVSFDEAHKSPYPMLAARALYTIATDTTSVWNHSILAWGHETDDDLLNAAWDRGKTLAELIRNADVALELLRLFHDESSRLISEFGFFGFNRAIPASLRICRPLSRRFGLTTADVVNRLRADLDRRRATLDSTVSAIRSVFPQAGKDNAQRTSRGPILRRLARVWTDRSSLGESASDIESEVATLGQRLFDQLMLADLSRV